MSISRIIAITSILVVILQFVTVQEASAQRRYQLAPSQIQAVTGGTCGYISRKWRAVRPSRSFPARYVVDRKAVRRVRRACQRLSRSFVISSLTQLPSTSELAKTSNTAESSMHLSAISGTPPALPDIPSLQIKNVFWRSGVVDGLNSGNPTQQQCSEFFNGPVDGQSGGLTACHMTQGVGYSFQNILQSGASLCYMKKAPTQANINAGGVSLVSGSLPNNDVTELFSPPTGADNRLVKVQVSHPQFGGQNIFIRVYSQAANLAVGNRYRVDLWFCSPQGQTAGAFENMAVSTGGVFTSLSTGQDDQGNGDKFRSLVTAYLTRQNGVITFDASRARQATVAFQNADATQTFKADLVITGDDKMYIKTYDKFGSDRRKAYTIAGFSGTSLANLRFLEGTYKDLNNRDGNNFTFTMATEYRTSYYASAPGSSLISELDGVNLTSDSFYSTPGSVTLDTSSYSCSATPDIVVAMNVGNATLQAALEECELDRLEGMNFCSSDAGVQQAQNNFFQNCQQ